MTIPAQSINYACPNCEHIFYSEGFERFGSYGGLMYSDGYITGKTSTNFPQITKCRKCDKVFWFRESKKICSSVKDLKPNYNAPLCNIDNSNISNENEIITLNLNEYQTAINHNNFFSKDDEIYLRKNIWWKFNNRIRNDIIVDIGSVYNTKPNKLLKVYKLYRLYEKYESAYLRTPFDETKKREWMIDVEKLRALIDYSDNGQVRLLKDIEARFEESDYIKFKNILLDISFDKLDWIEEIDFNTYDIIIPRLYSKEDKNIWSRNLEQLIKLYDINDDSQKIYIAEIYRNLYEFEKCLEVIQSIGNEIDEKTKKKYIAECKRGNSYVFLQ